MKKSSFQWISSKQLNCVKVSYFNPMEFLKRFSESSVFSVFSGSEGKYKHIVNITCIHRLYLICELLIAG